MPVRSFISGPYHLQHWDHAEAPEELVVRKDFEADFTYRIRMTIDGDGEVLQVIYAPPGLSAEEFDRAVAQLSPPDHPRFQLII